MKRRKIRSDPDAIPRDSQGRQRKRSYVPKRHHPGWLDSLDSRLGLVKDLRSRFTEICEDLGGAESLSYMQRSLVERSLWMEYQITQMEKALAEGGEPDTGKWTQAVNSLQGLYSRLGVERREHVLSVAEYFRRTKVSERADAAQNAGGVGAPADAKSSARRFQHGRAR